MLAQWYVLKFYTYFLLNLTLFQHLSFFLVSFTLYSGLYKYKKPLHLERPLFEKIQRLSKYKFSPSSSDSTPTSPILTHTHRPYWSMSTYLNFSAPKVLTQSCGFLLFFIRNWISDLISSVRSGLCSLNLCNNPN